MSSENPALEGEDLEDGEIESDSEMPVAEEETPKSEPPKTPEKMPTSVPAKKPPAHNDHPPKRKKDYQKFDSKNKNRDKFGRRPSFSHPIEDDIGLNIEKALRKVLKKKEEEQSPPKEKTDGSFDDPEKKKKGKKRKKRDQEKESFSKKKKKLDEEEMMDEDEFMCIRGASPIQKEAKSASPAYESDGHDSYASDASSHGSREHRSRFRRRPHFSERKSNKNQRRREGHALQDPDGVCLYYMQGKCHKGDDCIYSHDAQPPRKMELCKFYLMDCCAKRDKCLYMHSDFPCKYYHTGLPCIFKEDDCKFAHGKPLPEPLKTILLKHIETAPKEILGDFPRLTRENALVMLASTQARLQQQYFPTDNGDVRNEKAIPSLFELNIQKPAGFEESNQPAQTDNKPNKKPTKAKVRQSRWCDTAASMNAPASNSILSIQNLSNVLSPAILMKLKALGVEDLNQLSQLTVMQLNQIGLTMTQISDIQLNTMNIQKLGLINPEPMLDPIINALNSSKDLDMRVAPLPVVNTNPVSQESSGRDVDMRFVSAPPKQELEEKKTKDSIDIDQYTQDALKFGKNDCDNETIPESKDIDHRVLQYVEDASKIVVRASPVIRGSTTDDEDDNNLQIDEKWYSSDEEHAPEETKEKAKESTPPSTPAIEPSLLSKLGDLSKIDISAEVTKLLSSMKNNTMPASTDIEQSRPRDPRDPRSLPKKSPEHKPVQSEASKSCTIRKSMRMSIYECIDGEETDERKRSDVDLRTTNLSDFGDTDLRQTPGSGDVDLRTLPFKPIQNYTPATEINGSIASHPPMPYKLYCCDIPRPNYLNIKNSTPQSQAAVDPRIRKMLRLSVDESPAEPDVLKPLPNPRADPRTRRKDSGDAPEVPKHPSLDPQVVIQTSAWYQELSSNQKILVNQQLAAVSSSLKKFHQEKAPGKTFDMSQIHSNSILLSIFSNLGIALDDKGNFSYVNQDQLNYPQGMSMEMMNMLGMGPSHMGPMGMNNMSMGNMPSMVFDPRFGPKNPRNTPGLLGIAPNIPHNFDMDGFNGMPMNNFNMDNNFGGNNVDNFNGDEFNGNDYGGNDNDNFYRKQKKNFNRGGFNSNRGDRRGRGSNRGGSNRDRRNYNDRGSWKNDRR